MASEAFTPRSPDPHVVVLHIYADSWFIADSSLRVYDAAQNLNDGERSVGRKNLTFKQLERRRRLLTWAGIRESTLRDWLPILIAAAIPILIFLGTRAITLQQTDLENQRATQAQKIENRRAEAERELAEQRAQDEALQAYLDQMSVLLLEKNLRGSEEDSEVRTLARARTLTALGRLDLFRKTDVIQFLLEAKLVQEVEGKEPIIRLGDDDLDLSYIILGDVNLDSADLSEADLNYAELGDANLRDADLRRADLSKAHLQYSDLSGADLRYADLSDAFLLEADLSGANLRNADLSKAGLNYADLSGANLAFTDLSKADLTYADLSGAYGWTEDQLSKAKTLEGATMPDGQTLKGHETPNRPTFKAWRKDNTFEEWLKDKANGPITFKEWRKDKMFKEWLKDKEGGKEAGKKV
jgi:uncharacterized protein YjbI with pentapeptide repeats